MVLELRQERFGRTAAQSPAGASIFCPPALLATLLLEWQLIARFSVVAYLTPSFATGALELEMSSPNTAASFKPPPLEVRERLESFEGEVGFVADQQRRSKG
jgi:hypothetical protein